MPGRAPAAQGGATMHRPIISAYEAKSGTSQSGSLAPSSQRLISQHASKRGSRSKMAASSAVIGPPWKASVVLEPCESFS